MIYTLLLVARSRFFGVVFFLLLGLVLVSLCAAQFSGRQPATVALDVGISFIRMVLPLVVILLGQELFSNEIERRYFLFSLSGPVSRYRWLLQRFLVFVCLVAVVLTVMSSLLALAVWFVSMGYAQATVVDLGYPFFVVMLFVFFDALVLMAMASFLAVVASAPSFMMVGVLGFTLIARSFAAIISLLGSSVGLVGATDEYQKGLGALGYFLPDLGGLDVREIALYGRIDLLRDDWLWLILSSLIYALMLLVLAAFSLKSKRFV